MSSIASSPAWHPWSLPSAETFVPDGTALSDALARTTHLGIGAHADDLEIMAYHGIAACFQTAGRWFTGVTVTDGRGSAGGPGYASTSDDDLVSTRRREQRKAAAIGEYSAVVQLQHASSSVKHGATSELTADLDALLATMRPEVVYTHNLADKHDTHVAVALRVIAALRRQPAERRPNRLLGCEVWRDLDWLDDDDKIALAVDGREHLAEALLGVYDSQIAGGKRYDLATRGRRLAHATFFESDARDRAAALTFAMDLTPLLRDPALDPAELVEAHIARFATDVRSRIARL